MIIDINNNPIETPDLENGYLIDCTIAKPGAYETIDNVTKFALDDDDYIEVQRYIAIDPVKKITAAIKAAKSELDKSDYVIIRAFEEVLGATTAAELLATLAKLRKETAPAIKKRKELRAEIERLRAQVLK